MPCFSWPSRIEERPSLLSQCVLFALLSRLWSTFDELTYEPLGNSSPLQRIFQLLLIQPAVAPIDSYYGSRPTSFFGKE